MGELSILGVRHHGPGSARAVHAALAELSPEVVVIEGAPELDRVAALAGRKAMVPPVAAFVYGADQPERAMFYPLASFSPEWVALRWAFEHQRAVRFADLSAAISLAPGLTEALAGEGPRVTRAAGEVYDPLASIAQAAGYDDAEAWWEDAIERSHTGLSAFSALSELMAEARRSAPLDALDLVREAAMRKVLREVTAGAGGPVAVVCGAWHAPVLSPSQWPSAAADNARLRGLPKLKVEATWVPWSTQRLSQSSGYGAGVASPGWYEHLFDTPDDAAGRWLVRTARLLRQEHLAAPPASVVEAARLADALATLRLRPVPGLNELSEATRAAMCDGSPLPMGLVAERLVVGYGMGSVPAETPTVPLARDLAMRQARLRLKPSAAPARLDLDLRAPIHLQRSALFHRLQALGVPWAVPAETGRTTGTFRESWAVQWRPELEVALVVASTSGTTVEAAASSTLARRGMGAGIEVLCQLVEQALLADLPGALERVMTELSERSALAHDVHPLMSSVEPLARAARYGNVRRFGSERLASVLDGIITRVAVGLPPACSGLDDDAAASMAGQMAAVQRGVSIYDKPEARKAWAASLASVVAMAGAHGRVSGQAARTLLDGGWMSAEEARRRLSLALSVGGDLGQGAAFIEGFLSGEALLLVHDEGLLGVLDGWVSSVDGEAFEAVLPVLRRAFSEFQPAERRALGEKLRRSGRPAPSGRTGALPGGSDLAALALELSRPVLAQLLGLNGGGDDG